MLTKKMSKVKSQKSKVKNFSRRRTGFTLLLSLIVTSILLSIGIGIFEIIAREIRISSIGRESQIAFYAANAGVECAFYQEIINDAFSASGNITCGKTVGVSNGYDSVSGNSSFSFTLGSGTDLVCVEVEIDKSVTGITTVESKGYNTTCDSASPIKVQRGVRLNIKKQ